MIDQKECFNWTCYLGSGISGRGLKCVYADHEECPRFINECPTEVEVDLIEVTFQGHKNKEK